MKILFFILIIPVSFARPIRGTYEVPVKSPELKSFSTFPVKFKSSTYDNGFESLTFPLPAELTGQGLQIQMEKTNVPGKWMGPLVDADCAKIGRYFECQMRFRNLPFDEQGLIELMKEKFPGDESSQNLAKELAKVFGAEPAGILRYKLRGRERE